MFQFCYVTDPDLGIETVSCLLSQQVVRMDMDWNLKQLGQLLIDLVTVFDAILTSRQTREKLQWLYENLMSNNFRRTAVLKNNMICKLKLHS